MRTLEGIGGVRITDNVLLCSLLEPLDELVVDTLLNVDSATSTAALAVVEEDTKVDPRDGVVNVGVIEDNVGGLATKFEGDLLQVAASSGLHDLATDEGGTGEGDLVDIHVGGNGCTTDLTETSNDVDNTWWETSLLDERGGDVTGKRGLLSGLNNNSVTAGNGRTNLPCPHEKGEVPWDDLTTNTDLDGMSVRGSKIYIRKTILLAPS